MATAPLDLNSLLASLPDGVKAQALNYFGAAQSPQEFQQRLDALPIPRPVKAQIWDLRFSAPPSDPGRFTETPGVPPSVEAAPPPVVSPPTTDNTPPAPTPMNMPVKPIAAPPQPAGKIGPLPPVTNATQPISQQPPQGPPVSVPMAATPLYEQVSTMARTNPSFGAAKIRRETGADPGEISATLDRLVGEGAIKRTQNARKSTVYHALPGY